MNEQNNFPNYKKTVFDFNRSEATYTERVGEPDELSSVVGLISMGFQRLEDTLSGFIIEMFGVDIDKGKIIVAELSFTNKVNMFSSLVHSLRDTRKFNVGLFDLEEYFKELIKSILRCQDFRNQIVHSSLLKNFKTNGKIIRNKLSEKSKLGLKEIQEEINIPYLFDIYDYTISISMEIEQFFIDYNLERKFAKISWN